MWQRSEQSAAPLAKLGRTRFLLGATVATVGLFVTLGWVGVPGTQFSLNHDSQGTESIEAGEKAARPGPPPPPGARRTPPASRAPRRRGGRGENPKTPPPCAGEQPQP